MIDRLLTTGGEVMASRNFATVSKGAKKDTLWHTLSRDFKINKYKYLIIIPVIVYLAVFAYKPMYGLIIAFKDYRPALGFAGSKWVGLKHFKNFLLMYILALASQYCNYQRTQYHIWIPSTNYFSIIVK